MKEYRLAGWPELQPPYHRTAYRRLLSDMSNRYVTLVQLVDMSGLRRLEVQNFVEMLEARGLVAERERFDTPPGALFFAPFVNWLRRSWAATINND